MKTKTNQNWLKIAVTQLLALLFLSSTAITAQAGSKLYFVHSDHLAAQAVTDENQTIVWQGERRAFGRVTTSVNNITFDPRFPGQSYDEESGFHYNYFRYYDPTTGRYLTSDPIGLGGGLNTYAYVGGDPVNYSDPTGLKPGDYFPTPEATLVDVESYIHGTKPDSNKREYAGWVYKDKENGCYTYDEPLRATDGEMNAGHGPSVRYPGSQDTAWYHTHPDSPGNEEFSVPDRGVLLSKGNKPGALITSSGAIHVLSVKSGSTGMTTIKGPPYSGVRFWESWRD